MEQSRRKTKPIQPKKKRTVPDKMNVNGIPVACLRLLQLNVKWSALRGDGAGWLGENLQVSLPPSLCCLSLLCDVGHGTIHQDEQQDLLLAEERRMEWVPRGKQRSRPNLNDIILKSCCGDSFRERWHKNPQTTKLWVHHKFKAPFQWFWKL